MNRTVIDADLQEIFGTGLPWDDLDGARVVVSGATGLVGGYLVETLAHRHLHQGGEATALVILTRNSNRALQRFAHLPRSLLQVVDSDLSGDIDVDGSVDYIIHAASAATPSQFATDPVGSYTPNVIGTHHLLRLAADKDVKSFVFLSSGAAQGTVGPESVLDEDAVGPIDPLDPYAVYAESKRMAETMCVAWWRQHRLPVTTVRLGHTYGPGLRRDDNRAFSQFVYAALDGHDIVLHGDGTDRRDFCYLTDATVGIIQCLLQGERGRPYLLVNTDGSLTIGQLAELIAGLSPHADVKVRYGTDAGRSSTQSWPYAAPDVSRIKALGWRPTITPAEGFRRTLIAHASD